MPITTIHESQATRGSAVRNRNEPRANRNGNKPMYSEGVQNPLSRERAPSQRWSSGIFRPLKFGHNNSGYRHGATLKSYMNKSCANGTGASPSRASNHREGCPWPCGGGA